MRKGISIYLGMEKTWTENKQLMVGAAQLGFTEVFLSLHIPEANQSAIQEELVLVVQAAEKLGLKLIADITATTQVAQGITCVRLDDGFTPAMMAEYLQEQQDHEIVLNASTIQKTELQELQNLQVDFSRVKALHNFYPRAGTGLSIEFFQKQNALLKEYGIEVGAFVPSEVGKRGPVFKGLPTLECNRNSRAGYAARLLAVLGVDLIIIGDSGPNALELQAVAEVEDGINLCLNAATLAPWLKAFLSHTFTTRLDEAECAVRAVEGRSLAKNLDITPENIRNRDKGTVTIDNKGAGRYKGELEIVLSDLPSDPTVNVIGMISSADMKLLAYRKPGMKFRFMLASF